MKEVRKARGVSQRQLAALLDLNAAAVTRIERGERGVPLGEAVGISAVLDVSLECLLDPQPVVVIHSVVIRSGSSS